MTQVQIASKIESRILKIYYFVFFFYSLPFISLIIFLIDLRGPQKTEMFFWVLFLVGLMPCSIVGFLFSIFGLVKSFRIKSRTNKVIGTFGLILGFGGIFAGLLGIGLIYVVTS